MIDDKHQRTARGLVAVAPAQPAWLVKAVRAGGGEVVLPHLASAMVWTQARNTEALKEVVDANPQLLWVHFLPAGIESIAESGVMDKDRTWTSGKGLYATAVAEHALALVLAIKRRLPLYAREIGWSQASGSLMSQNQVVVLGAGGVARSFIRLVDPFECRVTVVRRKDQTLPGVEIVTFEALDTTLPQADVVVIAAALTSDTRHVINRRRLQLLKEDAVLVNVGRGEHVVTDDLQVALETNTLGGAGLDVTDPEPLPADHRLWSLNNCLITPHTANPPRLARSAAADRVRSNVAAWIADKPLEGIVDPKDGY